MCDHLKLHNIPEHELLKKRTRRKIWEMELSWHCAIIGTCLTQGDVRKLTSKTKLIPAKTIGDQYKHHSFLVSNARYNQGVGKLIQKFLEKKYARILKVFEKAKTSDDVNTLWQQAKEEGDLGGGFWAVLSHQASSFDLLNDVYGEIHMLSHLEGAHYRNSEKEIALLKDRLLSMENEKFKIQQQNRQNIDKRDHLIGQLKAELAQNKEKARRCDELEAMLLAERDGLSIATLENRIDHLNARIIQETDRAHLTQKRYADLEVRFNQLHAELRRKDKENKKYKKEMFLLKNAESTEGSVNEEISCLAIDGCAGKENSDLCGRCIAYVGGQTKQAAFFREYVEKNNGQFLYHDGGLHDGQARLHSILSQADAVMFPVTCISHEASREIKRVCMQQEKRFLPLRSQGLSAFTKGIDELVEEESL